MNESLVAPPAELVEPLPAPEILPAPEREKAARARSGSFGSDMLKLVSGTVFAQVVALLATPFITRLFSPDAYGTGVAFTSLTTVFLVFLCLRYEQAIMLPADESQAANALGVSLAAMVVVTSLVGLLIWLWGDVIMGWMRLPELIPYLWMLAPGLVISGLLLVITQWNVRTRRFGQVATGQVINSLSMTGSRLASGLAGYGTGGAMIVTGLFGAAAALVYQAVCTLRESGALFRRTIRPAGMVAMMRRYSEMPLYGTWAALLNSISWQLPIFLLAAFFSPAVAGQYALGNRIIKLPMSLVGDAIGKVFYQRAAEAAHEGTLASLTEATFKRLVAFGLPPMLFLTLVGRDLFALVFGAEWADAGVYMQLLGVWAFFWFISSPFHTLVYVLGLQRFYFIWNAINFATRFASLWIGGMLANATLALGLFGLSGVVVYGFICLYLLRAAGVPIARALSILAVATLYFLPAAGLILVLRLLDAPVWLRVLLPALVVGSQMLYAIRNEPHARALLARLRRR